MKNLLLALAALLFFFQKNMSAQCLAGQYTVGFQGDFANLDSLQKRLDGFGVCGPTRVLLLPGEVLGGLDIVAKHGVNGQKTLEIAPLFNEKGSVRWGTDFLGGGVDRILIDSSEGVSLRGIKIEVPIILNNSRFLTLEAIEMSEISNFEMFRCGHVSIKNRPINSAFNGFWLRQCEDVLIENCSMDRQLDPLDYRALKIDDGLRVRVEKCRFDGPVRFRNCRNVDFLANEVAFSVAPFNPLEGALELTDGDSIRVTNNFLATDGPIYRALATIYEVKNCTFAHNTMSMKNAQNAVLRVNTPFAAKIFNNIVVNQTPSGPTFLVESNAANIESNHNVFWPDAVHFFPGIDLQNWQTTSGQDVASIVFKPTFLSHSDLRIVENPAELAAKAAFLINFSEKDIDGDPRPIGSADLGADQFSGLKTDAKLIFQDPSASCHGLPTLIVRLKNEGPDTLRTARIFSKFNSTDSLPTHFWRGSLAAGETSGPIRLGDFFGWNAGGTAVDLRVSASRDDDATDDRFYSNSVKNQMGGAYTVGGSMPDFRTLYDAVLFLKNAGFCADARLLVRPGAFVFAEFGANWPSANGRKLIVEPENSGLLDGVIDQAKIFGLPNLELRRLRLRGFRFDQTAYDLAFENCEFLDQVIDASSGDERMAFRNCRFPNGYSFIGGSSLGYDTDVLFENCDFGKPGGEPTQSGSDDISLAYISNLTIRNCRFERMVGPLLRNPKGRLRVEQNSFSSSPALQMTGGDFVAQDSARIANNFFRFRGIAPVIGSFGQANLVEIFQSKNIDFLHNSLLFEPENAGGKAAAFAHSNTQSLRFENNLIKTTGDATAFFWSDFQGEYSNHNHFDLSLGFVSGASDLAFWQFLTSGFDQNSTVGAVKFEAENDPTGLSDDLHLATDSPNLPMTSNVLAGLTTDFDGQKRGLGMTQIGADEAGVLPVAGMVWPGDCDSDKKVTTLDWLHLGLAIGQNLSGPTRPDPAIFWSPKFAEDWPDSVQNVNSKHSDGDGDGLILAKDTAAIALNFGDEHFILGLPMDRNGLQLFIDLPSGPFSTGQKIAAPIRLAAAPESIYGLAVELEFSQNAIKTGSFWADFGQNWPGSDAIGFFEKGASDRISLALTKTNGSDAAGFGQIGTLQFEVGPLADSLKIRAIGTRGLLADGSEKAILPAALAAVDVVLASKNAAEKIAFEAWPNPTDGLLFLKITHEKTATAEVFDALGRLVFSQKMEVGEAVLNFQNLASGLFELRVLNEKGAATRRVLVQK